MAGGGFAATLVLRIVSDVSGAQKGLQETEGTLGKVQGGLGRMVGPAAIALGAVTAFGLGTADAASDVEQSLGAVESVFKENSKVIEGWAEDAATTNGLAQADYQQMAAVIGAQLKGMGTDMDKLAPKTDQLIDLGSDLAATFGGETSDAVAAVSSLLKGERDPIEKYGVSIKQADINARLAAQGLGDLEGAERTQAESTAVLAILMEKTADAQGAAAREADTAAAAQARAGASATNMAAELGEALLPAIVLVSDALTILSGFIADNKTLVLVLVGAVAALAAGILAANAVMAIWNGLQTIMAAKTAIVTAAQWALNTALLANPIGIIILAIVGLVAALVLAYQKSETFRRIVDAVFKAVLDVVKTVVAWITTNWAKLAAILAAPFNVVKGVVASVGRFITDMMNTIKRAIQGVMDFITGIGRRIQKFVDDLPDIPDLNPFSAVPPAPAPAALTRGLGRSSLLPGGAGGRGSNVTLILDREVFGRATIASVRRYDRRNGAAQVLPRWS